MKQNYVYLAGTPKDTLQSQETQQVLNQLCEEYEDIFLLSEDDIDHNILLNMDIDTWDHPPFTQSLYALPLKHSLWVCEELEILEKAGIISRSVSPWSSPIVIVPKIMQPGEISQECLCIDYHMLNSLLPIVV